MACLSYLGKYNPHSTWRELFQHRELAMAKRHVAHHEKWSEHTTWLDKLKVGDKVFVQNQLGKSPRRWERTGVILECKEFDQYVVKIDGTGRPTVRNGKGHWSERSACAALGCWHKRRWPL